MEPVFLRPERHQADRRLRLGAGDLLDGAGSKVHTFAAKPAHFSIPVLAGQDGKLWKFQNSQGQRLLMTVPPCLARNERELLLPREVVERDSAKK